MDRSDGEYKYYIPSEYSGVFEGKARYANSADVYIEFSLGAPFSSVKLDNNDYTKSNGAYVNILKSDINDYQVHKLDVVATNGKAIIYLKRVKKTGVTFVDNQWEKYRNESITWDKVDGAIKYAIYVDGKLYITTDDENTTSISVPAYAFAKATNNNGQATTVGKHTTAVVAIKNGDEIKETASGISLYAKV